MASNNTLTSAIFGVSSETGEVDEKSPFSTTRVLPDRPQKTNFTKVVEKKKDEPDPKITPGGKKKRRKLNANETTDKVVTENKDADTSSPPEVDESGKEKEASIVKTKEVEGSELNENKEADSNDEASEEAEAEAKEENSQSVPETILEDEEQRTIFVGNLPSSTTRKKLASMFKPCGTVASARIRSLSAGGVKLPKEQAGNQNLAKKVAVNTNNLQKTTKKTIQGYVVFESESSVPLALKMNGTVIDGTDLVLRVDHAKPTIDSTRSVFVGNLPYKADETSLRKHFMSGCGMKDDDIENVRIVRDSETMQCKGFGYILFKEKNSIPDALKLHESEYLKRSIRVNICGKRMKGKRGKESKKKKGDEKLSGGAKRVLQKSKATKDDKTSPINKNKKTVKESKKRGVKNKNSIPHKAGTRGISKRKSSSIKVEKRVKKIQKRIAKGMGKAKK